jgi:3-phosphoshikimate 1-carboxyvinyltransferase
MFDQSFLDLPPLAAVAGTVRLPGSKSISNRVLLLAGLSEGTTIVHDLLDSDDTRVMLAALRELGCGIADHGEGGLHVTGLAGRLLVKSARLHLGNAGTAMRPLTAALALLAATQGGDFELSGVARMHERPIADLVDALRRIGCTIDCPGQEGYPPLRLRGEPGTALSARGTSQPIRVRGDVSSQFLTALLLALPLVSHDGDQVVEVDGELISKPYVEITLNMLARFGVEVLRDGFRRFTVPAGSRYRTPGALHVEGDASSASYFIAAGAIAAVDAPIRIHGVGLDSIQGDIRFLDAAQAMGAQVAGGDGWIEVRRGDWPLKAVDLDCNEIPDAAMTLAAMALFADGTTRLRNIASWRVKETDRIAAMATELRRVGATVVEGPDFIEVTPPQTWHGAAIHTYDDHRIAMCLSLAALNPTRGFAKTTRILDPRCVAKTFPDYFETLFSVARAAPGAIPVITIDGPTASGKGTLAQALARRLGWHALDSGLLYRAAGVAALRRGVATDDGPGLASLARSLDLRFDGERVLLEGQDVSDKLRTEAAGAMASRVAAQPELRRALVDLQIAFRRLPGLVADGRDMGTVIFPDAALKVFLVANVETRAQRRHKQLISKGLAANIDDLRAGLEARDNRDRSRSAAPLEAAQDALELDNSGHSVDQSVDWVLDEWNRRMPLD